MKTDRGPKETPGALWAAAGFGLLGIIFAGWAEYLFLPQVSSLATPAYVVLLGALGVGLIEECAKFIPLALFIRKKAYFNEHTDGIIYFGIAGLTFGFIENVLYATVYSHAFSNGQWTGISRLITLFFFHAASVGIVGYYFAKAKIQHQKLTGTIIALITMIVIHGLYDFMFLYSALIAQRSAYAYNENGLAIAVIAMVAGLSMSAILNTCLFLYYGRARAWDMSIGLAVPKGQPLTQAPQQSTVPPVTVSAQQSVVVPVPVVQATVSSASLGDQIISQNKQS